MQMPTKWPTLTVSSSCVRATKGAPTAATLATAADVFKKSLRFMAVSGDRSGGRQAILMHHPCHGCFEALHTLAHTSLVRGSPYDQNAGMLHMEAAGPVSGRGRQRNGEAQAKRPGAPCCLEANAAFVTATDLLIDGGYIAFKGRIAADGRPAMI